jgi:LCP family protein required for cell wall assembly
MSHREGEQTVAERTEMQGASGAPDAVIAVRPGRLPRHSGTRALLTFTGAALAVLLVSTTAVAGYAVLSTVGTVSSNAIDITGPSGTPPPEPPAFGAIEGGFNLLVVGTDNDANQGEEFGDRDATLNDVNILLHVSDDHQSAVAISLPRDLVIAHPECTDPETGEVFDAMFSQPLNDAYERGGLGCVVNTVTELTALPIDYAAVVSFNGVIALSNAVGGVPVCLVDPIEDPESGLNLPAGESVISGGTALAYLRARYGVGDGSDLSRISNQQAFLSSLLRTVRSDQTLSDPVKLYGLAHVAAENMRFSTSLANPATMISLALSLKDIPLEKIVFVQYPVVDSAEFSGKVEPNQELADQLMALVQSDQPFLLPDGSTGNGVESGDAGEAAPPAETPVTEPPATDPEAPTDGTETPVAPPVLEGLSGQTAGETTCAKANG